MIRLASNARRGRASSLSNYLPFTTSSYGSEDGIKVVDIESLFSSCSDAHSVKRIHTLLLVSGKTQSAYINTRLVNLYAHLGDISSARQTFDHISSKDAYTWNSMISAFVRSGRFCDALNCFHWFVCSSVIQPDWYTFPPVVKACRSLNDGKIVHGRVLKTGLMWDVFIAASLIHFYSRLDLVGDAHDLFESMPHRDPASWNAMISGFCLNDGARKALNLAKKMRLQQIRLDPVTVASILPACAEVDDLSSGIMIHVYVIKCGLEFDVFVSNALVNMYGKFGLLHHTQRVFNQMIKRDLVSWNSIISAYEQNGDAITAFDFFRKAQIEGQQPDLLTLVSLASIIAQAVDRDSSRSCNSVHGFVTRRLWLMEDVIAGNAIMDMYAKLGYVNSAHKVFDLVPIRDVISWNTLITGYSQNGLASEAIDLFNKMESCTNIRPNQGTWVSILPALSHIGALQHGMKIHGRIIKTPLHYDMYVSTCLVDMYGKCGRLEDALSLFDQVPNNSSVPWNAIISNLGIHGNGEVALELFEEMLQERVKPDHVTFLSLISACSHAGLVDQGFKCFHMMQADYEIKPNLKHYGGMVDLLGRAGKLERAYDFIKDMPIQPDASVWGALLGACRIHGNIELGKFASAKLFEIDSENVGYYVLLSNMYAKEEKWDEMGEVRSVARDKGLDKTPGWSSIEVDKNVDVFYTGNKSHPRSDEIYKELEVLSAKMKRLGYVPDYSFVLQDVEEDEKEHILSSHSERLAIAYGLITTPPRSTIRIFKNLRVCGDCHTATKLISLITERDIIVRDSNRFHHFKEGKCSCRDYW